MSAVRDADALASYESTLQHIGLMREKIERLTGLMHQAEAQLAHRAGTDYQAGLIELADLAEVYDAYRAVTFSGYSKRWDESCSTKAAMLANELRLNGRSRSNGPNGSWFGAWPLAVEDSAPPRGRSVVYVLYDAANVPCYVGSTYKFRQRLLWHTSDGKQFTSWTAFPCADRASAYAMESRLLKEHKPYLNKKAAR